jgi:hypothetical protein
MQVLANLRAMNVFFLTTPATFPDSHHITCLIERKVIPFWQQFTFSSINALYIQQQPIVPAIPVLLECCTNRPFLES